MRINKILLSLLVMLVCFALFIVWFYRNLTSPVDDVSDFDKYRPTQPVLQTSNTLKVSFYGVSTLAINDGDSIILIDAFFSRPSTLDVLFSKVNSDQDVVISALKVIDAESALAL